MLNSNIDYKYVTCFINLLHRIFTLHLLVHIANKADNHSDNSATLNKGIPTFLLLVYQLGFYIFYFYVC